jgi:glyoxylase-like metal-dependent hydrolase (beta-lactamase superfamily II)
MPTVTPALYRALDGRIRVFRCDSVPVDSFAVLTERFAVLVDTLIGDDAMRQVLAHLAPDLAGRQVLVVNTHGDWDHVWGNGLFAGPDAPYPAPILGHEGVADRMEAAEAMGVLDEKRAESVVYSTAGWHPPTVTVSGPACIEGGDFSLHLLPTPGHTPDHLAVWIPEIRLLLAGDAAEWPFPEAGDSLPDLRHSLRLMRDLRPSTVLCCHAPGRTDPGVIDANLAYFDELERRVRAGREWPAAEVIPAELEGSPERALYESFHRRNTEKVRSWLQGQ